MNVDNKIEHKIDSKVKVMGENGSYKLLIEPQPDTTIIGMSKYYRDEWVAHSNQNNLKIIPLFNAFIGIVIPPNTSIVNVRYYPEVKIILERISSFVIITCIIFLVLNRKKIFYKFK